MTDKFTLFSTFNGHADDVDSVKGIIRNVSVITEGIAKGHGFGIDSESRSTLLACVKNFAKGVLVKLKHKANGEHQSVINESVGSLQNFRQDGNQLKADFVLLSSLAEKTKETIYELARNFYDQFGFSPTAEITLEEKEGGKFARFTRVMSVDLTDEPAANVSLFSAACCEFCGASGCSKDHDETELSAAWESGDSAKKLSVESYAVKRNKKLSKKPTCMSEITKEAFDALQKQVTDLTTALAAKNTAGAIQFTGADGKVVSLSAGEIYTKLAAADTIAADAVKAKEMAERNVILSTMEREGRVPMNPKTKAAFTRVELEALPIDRLEFLSVNAPVIPLAAKAVYRGSETPAIPKEVKGTDRIALAIKNAFHGATTSREMVSHLSRTGSVEV